MLLAWMLGCRELHAGTPETSAGRQVRIIFHFQPETTPLPETRVRLLAGLPQTIAGRQEVLALTYSHSPREFTENGIKYGEWLLPVGKGGVTLTITANLRLSAYRLPQERPGNVIIPDARWTAAEPHLESDAPEIRRLADAVPPGGTTLDAVRGIYQCTLRSLAYRGFVPAAEGALAALRRGHGDCTDFTDLFVALCRARGIPARHVSGYITKFQRTSLHSWAEFWTPETSWVPVDLSHGKMGKTAFGKLPAHYIAVDNQRNNSRFGGGMLYLWQLDTPGEVRLRSKVTVK